MIRVRVREREIDIEVEREEVSKITKSKQRFVSLTFTIQLDYFLIEVD